MTDCKWDENKHGGKPCPIHKIRNTNGKKEVNNGDGWSEISQEEFEELKNGGYEEEFDDDYESDFEEDDVPWWERDDDPITEYPSKDVNYAELVRYSNDDSDEYRTAKIAITSRGRGLAKRLDSENLSPALQEIKDSILKSAKPSKWDMSIYRTDDVDWLKNAKVGSLLDMNTYISGSLDKDLVIPENEGNVKQKIKFNVKKGDPILAVNNANEQEVSIVKKGHNQMLKIDNITKDENGIPVYEVSIIKG